MREEDGGRGKKETGRRLEVSSSNQVNQRLVGAYAHFAKALADVEIF